MPRRALILLLPIAGLAGVAGLLINGTELGPVTGLLEQVVSRAIERPVTFAQPPRIELGRDLIVDIPSLQLGNADWGASTPLLQFRELHARIVLKSLFSGPVIVRELRARDLELQLEIREDGSSNLPDFGDGDSDSPIKDIKKAKYSPPFFLESLQLNNVEIRYDDRRNNSDLVLSVETLIQSSDRAAGLRVNGNGQLQGAAWNLSLDATAMQSMAPDQPYSTELRGTLADMLFEGSAQLPELRSLADLTLTLDASGKLPRRVTDLSPLLQADTPINLSMTSSDIDPGINVDLKIQLPNIALEARGSVQKPIEGDGLSIAISANAANASTLTETLQLGDIGELPFELTGHIERYGTRLGLNDLHLLIGEHRWTGDAVIPDFPHTKGARMDLTAVGPDFSFYQRLLQRPVSFPLPYQINASLRAGKTGPEVTQSLIQIGPHEVSLEGPIGDFPSYRGSDLRIHIRGPDANAISTAFGVSLPVQPYQVEGRVAIAQDDGTIMVDGLTVDMATLSASGKGRMNGYPEFDDLDFTLSLSTESLAETSSVWGLGRLGDVPAKLSAQLSGGVQAPKIGELDLVAGGLSMRSASGKLALVEGELSSDLELEISLFEQRQLLGDYGDERMLNLPISLHLTPRLNDSLINIGVSNIRSEGISGSAEFGIGRDMSFDKRLYLNADLTIENAGRFFPVINDYRAPEDPIALAARTTRSQSETQLSIMFRGKDNASVSILAKLPDDTETPRLITISGSGDDVAALGKLDSIPKETLPFAIDADIAINEKETTLLLRELNIGDSAVRGSGSIDSVSGALQASILVPEARLDQWTGLSDDDRDSEEKNAPPVKKSRDSRLIPDYPVPVAWLSQRPLAIDLQTGPLGLADPEDSTQSLIDYFKADLNSGNGKAALQVVELRGSRGSASGRVDMEATQDIAAITTALTIKELKVGPLLSTGGLESLPRASVEANFSAKGSSTRGLAATLSGEFLVSGGPGKIKPTSLEIATGSFLNQLIATLIPSVEGEKENKIECSVLAARAEKGVIRLDPGFVSRNQNVDLSATGVVDLSSETIRIRFNNKARKGLGVSAAGLVNPYVQITGTLAKPALSLDIKGSAISGGAAAATGGLSVVAKTFYDRFLDRNDPCEAALTAWRESSG